MKTRIVAPPDWTVSTIDDGGRVVWIVEGGLRIELHPVVPAPPDRRAWVEANVARDVPPGARLELIAQADDATNAGAPMTLVTARVRRPDGEIVEVRHVAFYVFGEQVAVVGCHLLGREATARFSAELEGVLRSAHVDPTVEVARLDDLYS